MTTIDQELIDIALEALSNHKVDIDKAKKDISTVNSTVKKVDSVLKASIDNLADKLSVVDKGIPNLVKEEVAKIPVPKNGRDGKDFDVEAVKPIIADEVQEVEKKAIDKVHQAIKAIPKPKDGKDGRNGLNGKSGKDGKDGKTIKGDKGPKGVPGVGIEDITASNDRIKVKLTDGKVKEVIIPKFVAPSTGIVAPVGNPEIQTLRNLADTAVNNAENGQTLVYNNGMWVATALDAVDAGNIDSFQKRTEIEAMFKAAEGTSYKELTYTEDGKSIINVDIYTDETKTTKLFSKIIGYNNGNITSVSITDEVNGGTLDKTIAYVDDNISSISSTYTS